MDSKPKQTKIKKGGVKMKPKTTKHFWKRVCSAGLSLTLLATLFSPAQIHAGEVAGRAGETLQIAAGGTHFFKGATMDGASSSSSDIVTLEEGEQSQQALFDRTGTANNNLTGYSTTPNEEVKVSDAEFTATFEVGYYTFYNEKENTYLANNGSSYMSPSKTTHLVEKVENPDGTVSFEIQTEANASGNGRYVYFYYNEMKFDGMSHRNGTTGDYGIEFLEKQDSISEDDPIPGYRRATDIVNGHTYLITEYYHDTALGDAIIVAYPKNGNDLSKLYRSVDVSGVVAKAVGNAGQETTVTVGGTTYTVQITGCDHEGYQKKVTGKTEADCENPAFTGDTYCMNCNQKIADGSFEGEALGHNYGDWAVTQEPTAQADGKKSRTCVRCDNTEEETYTYGEYVQSLLDEKIKLAEQIVNNGSAYETIADVESVLDAAKALAEDAADADKAAALNALNEAIGALVIANPVESAVKPNAQDTSLKNYFSYTAYSGKGWSVGANESYIDLGESDEKAEECYYEIHFEGHAISVTATKGPAHGKVKFILDDDEAHARIVDLYNGSRVGQEVYSESGLIEGTHVLRAVTLNDKTGSAIVNQVTGAVITHAPYRGGTPDLGGTIEDTNWQYTQDRYNEISAKAVNKAALTAWRNDKALSEIVLFSKNCSLENVSITASSLKSAGGDTISSENVKLTFIKSTKAYNGSYLGYGNADREYPAATAGNRSESSDILYQEGGSYDIEWNSLQPVWVEFNIPKNAEPGNYIGTVRAIADGIAKPLTFTYQVKVQDETLPDADTYADTFDIELWQYPYSSAEYYNVEPFSEEHLELMKSSMLKYKEIGGHAITTTIVEDAWSAQTYSKNDIHYPSMVKWTKEGDSFTYDYTDFDKWVTFCKEEIGIGDKIILYSIAPWHGSFTYWENGEMKKEGYSAGNDRYKKVWGDFLRDLISHLESKGWFDDSYIGIDERGFSAAAFDLIEEITNEDGKCLKTAGAMDGFVNKKDLALRVSDLNVGDTAAKDHPEEFAELLTDRTEKGFRTTLYSCTEHSPGNFSLSMPAESYWSVVNAGKMGTAGFLRWAYDAWVEDPLNDATHNSFEPGDCFLIYPDETDAETPTSKSSVRLERMAEGVRDINKLMLIEKEMPELAEDIQALYSQIETTPRISRNLLDNSARTALANEMTAFKAGVAEITNQYLKLKNKPGIYTDVLEKNLKVGDVWQISAESVGIGSNALVYKSKDTSVATVDANGRVTARGKGSTSIILNSGTHTTEVKVTVEQNTLIISNALTEYKLPEKYLSDVHQGPQTGDEHYLGQPDMIMLDDNKTLYTVFPVGHGRGRIIMKVSHDAGETWEEKTDIPESWSDSFETPTIYKLNMTDGTTKLIVISGRPANFGAQEGGWDTSISTDDGETWSEFQTYQKKLPNGSRNETVVAMASLVQLKDDDGNYIDKWMGVYHDGGSFVNYKTYLTFDEDGNQQWSDPVAYLSEYRSIEWSHQICEVGMFRSPDGNRIVALARNQTHNGPAVMFYSDDEGDTWSEPTALPGSLAGERHKAMYDPTDPTGQRLIVTFREIKYDLNGNNQFDGGNDWVAGDWIAWVGTYDDIMSGRDGSFRILLCEDWANNAKSGDTGYSGLVVLPDGTFIMDTYGHWDKGYSQSLPNYNVHNDWCWIKQAKFKLSEIDESFTGIAQTVAPELAQELLNVPADTDAPKYTEESWEVFEQAYENAKSVNESSTSKGMQYYEALSALKQACQSLVVKGADQIVNLEDLVKATSVVLNTNSIVLKASKTEQLGATVEPTDMAWQKVRWESSDTAVAEVDDTGMVTGMAEGEAVITAISLEDETLTAQASVTVEPLPEDIQAAQSALKTVLTEAASAMEAGPQNYTETTWNKFLAAYNLAEEAKNSWDTAKLQQLLADLEEAKNALKTPEAEAAQEKLGEALTTAASVKEAGQQNFSTTTWNKFLEAYKRAEESKNSGDVAKLQQLLKALEDAQNGLKTKQQEAVETAQKALGDALTTASSVKNAGQRNYSEITWKAFLGAYNLAEAGKNSSDTAKLQQLLTDLKAAQKALAPKQEEQEESLKEFEAGGSKYKVINAAGQTVMLVKGKNAKNVTVNTVSKDGKTYKVTAIGGKAFVKCTKLTSLTIGANVKTIAKNAFNNCKKLGKITFKGKTLPTMAKKAFQKTKAKPTVKVNKKLRKNAKAKNNLAKKLKKAGLNVTSKNIK